MVADVVATRLEPLRKLCRENGIAELSVFGSAVRDDFTETSDVDLMVQFKPGRVIGLLGMSALQLQMSELLGRNVDLVTVNELHPRIRESVLKERSVVYVSREE